MDSHTNGKSLRFLIISASYASAKSKFQLSIYHDFVTVLLIPTRLTILMYVYCKFIKRNL
jgi:hypothetical protein